VIRYDHFMRSSPSYKFQKTLLATALIGSGAPLAAQEWQRCATITDDAARLSCYDQTAKTLAKPQPLASPIITPGSESATPATPPASTQVSVQRMQAQPSEITRFWDLEATTARDTFELRAYRPISLSLATADTVNEAPSSPSPGRNATALPYSKNEVKINLSVRTKIASGLLRRGGDPLRDSLWVGYTQQSYWQLFNGGISRPFRSTDHEPELIYLMPTFAALPAGWAFRMGGVGLVHQSNGQTLPLSRSWNRAYLLAAADKIASNGDRFTLSARIWRRLPEKADKDDNPDISNYIGRAELAGRWSFDTGTPTEKTNHTLGLTLRHALRKDGNGSVRLEYLRSIGKPDTGLRLHVQLFSGYGDSLVDYNRKRNVLTIGLSLVDW
jgi:phospholipase A1/A2